MAGGMNFSQMILLLVVTLAVTTASSVSRDQNDRLIIYFTALTYSTENL